MKYFLLLFLTLQTFTLRALDVPYLSGRVVDEVGVLDQNVIHTLEEKLKTHEKETSNQIAVLIIPSLEGEILEEYSLKVATTWKLGQKEKNNGVLLLIVINDRKLRIEVGYGLEGVLTDALCSRIIRNQITPYFKQGNFSQGVENGVNSILDALNGTYQSNEENQNFILENDSNYLDILNQIDNSVPLFFRIFMGFIFFTVMTPFTVITAVTPYFGWFLYFFLMPFYATFPIVIFGKWGVLLLPIYAIGMLVLKILFALTEKGGEIAKKINTSMNPRQSSGSSSSSGFYSSGSSSSGFSGGGGSFGGGGSSGSW